MRLRFRTRLCLVAVFIAILSILLNRFYLWPDIDINLYDTYYSVSYSAVIFVLLFFIYLIIETLFHLQSKRQ